MPTDYTAEQQSAKAEIEEAGREVTLLKPNKTGASTGPAFDRARTGDITYDEETIIVLQTRFKSDEIDGKRILQSDIRYLVAGDIQLSGDYKILDNGIKYSIVNIEAVNPATPVILYKVQVR